MPRISWSAAVKAVWLRGVSCEQAGILELSAVGVAVPMDSETRWYRHPCQELWLQAAWSGQARSGNCERCCRPLPRKAKARIVLCQHGQGRQGPGAESPVRKLGLHEEQSRAQLSLTIASMRLLVQQTRILVKLRIRSSAVRS